MKGADMKLSLRLLALLLCLFALVGALSSCNFIIPQITLPERPSYDA